MGNNAPNGYLKCDGTVYDIEDYPFLAEHFETEFGTKNHFGGDGETTFAVPNLQGEFLRGTGTNSHINQNLGTTEGSGGDVGVHQDATLLQNNGFNPMPATDKTVASTLLNSAKINRDSASSGVSNLLAYEGYVNLIGAQRYNTTYGGAITSRPTNTSVLYCIKF